jgi:hypothetical protein
MPQSAPVKNRPITARSTAIRSRSSPRMSVTPAIVWFKMRFGRMALGTVPIHLVSATPLA